MASKNGKAEAVEQGSPQPADTEQPEFSDREAVGADNYQRLRQDMEEELSYQKQQFLDMMSAMSKQMHQDMNEFRGALAQQMQDFWRQQQPPPQQQREPTLQERVMQVSRRLPLMHIMYAVEEYTKVLPIDPSVVSNVTTEQIYRAVLRGIDRADAETASMSQPRTQQWR